eukprot:COSAG01_NODE_90_length_27307_cov_734.166458_27_plen_85_part_00
MPTPLRPARGAARLAAAPEAALLDLPAIGRCALPIATTAVLPTTADAWGTLCAAMQALQAGLHTAVTACCGALPITLESSRVQA